MCRVGAKIDLYISQAEGICIEARVNHDAAHCGVMTRKSLGATHQLLPMANDANVLERVLIHHRRDNLLVGAHDSLQRRQAQMEDGPVHAEPDNIAQVLALGSCMNVSKLEHGGTNAEACTHQATACYERSEGERWL